MAAWQEPDPTTGARRTADNVQVVSNNPRPVDVMQPITASFEAVKAQPAETVGAIFVSFIFLFIVSFVLQIFSMIGTGIAGVLARAVMGIHRYLGTAVLITTAGFTGILSWAIGVVFQAIVMCALNILWLRIFRGQDLDLNNLTEAKRFMVPMIITTFLLNLAIFAGMMALIIPGYILAFGLMFASYIVIDHNLRGVEALKASWKLTQGHKLNLFLMCIVLGFLNMAGMLACGVGMLFTIPITAGAVAYYYDAISSDGNAYLTQNEKNGGGAHGGNIAGGPAGGWNNPNINQPM